MGLKLQNDLIDENEIDLLHYLKQKGETNLVMPLYTYRFKKP